MSQINETGLIKISEAAVASVVAVSAAEVDGVKAVGGKKPKKISKKANKVVQLVFENGSVKIDLSVIVRYGCSIPDVGREIQENVIASVEAMTGLKVEYVNVHCTGISFPREGK